MAELVDIEPGAVDFNGAGLPAGSVVRCLAGEYEKLRFRNLAGAPGLPITIVNHGGQVRASGGDWVTLRGCEYVRFTGSGVPSTECGFLAETTFLTWDGSQHIEYERVEMRHGRMRISSSEVPGVAASNFHVHHCHFTEYGATALYIGKPNVAFEDFPVWDVVIEHNLIERMRGSGIKVVNICGCEIRDNTIDDVNMKPEPTQNMASAIRLSGYADRTRVHRNVVNRAVARAVFIELSEGYKEVFNNLFIGCGQGFEGCRESYKDVVYAWGSRSAHIYHNTIVGAARHGVHFAGGESADNFAFNNIITGTSGEPVVGVEAHHNLSGAVEDFGFVDPSSGDYHLTADSPAVGAGVAVPGLAEDLDGKPRPVGRGYDVGCYEYQAPGCSRMLRLIRGV